jgi:hypothetical protein
MEHLAEQLLPITPGSPQAGLGSTDNVVMACQALLEQVDLPTAAAILGHSRLDAVRISSQPDQEFLQRAANEPGQSYYRFSVPLLLRPQMALL